MSTIGLPCNGSPLTAKKTTPSLVFKNVDNAKPVPAFVTPLGCGKSFVSLPSLLTDA